jgi:hypothetical protein
LDALRQRAWPILRGIAEAGEGALEDAVSVGRKGKAIKGDFAWLGGYL